MVKFFLDDLL